MVRHPDREAHSVRSHLSGFVDLRCRGTGPFCSLETAVMAAGTRLGCSPRSPSSRPSHPHPGTSNWTGRTEPLSRPTASYTLWLPVIPTMILVPPPPPPPKGFPSCAGSPRWREGGREGKTTQPTQIPAAALRPYRLGVVLKHLPGLLLAAVLLHALPLQVPLLGLLKDLVRSTLPLPQELGSLRGTQQHGWAAETRAGAGGGEGRGGGGEEQEEGETTANS